MKLRMDRHNDGQATEIVHKCPSSSVSLVCDCRVDMNLPFENSLQVFRSFSGKVRLNLHPVKHLHHTLDSHFCGYSQKIVTETQSEPMFWFFTETQSVPGKAFIPPPGPLSPQRCELGRHHSCTPSIVTSHQIFYHWVLSLLSRWSTHDPTSQNHFPFFCNGFRCSVKTRLYCCWRDTAHWCA